MFKNIKMRGFTLVELLAVIVILGILLLLAVPATQNVVSNARKTTFQEYTQKTLNLIEQKLQEDEIRNKSIDSDSGCYMYNIKTDLGLPDTGEYKGYFAVISSDVDLGIPNYFNPIMNPPIREIQTFASSNIDIANNSKVEFLEKRALQPGYYPGNEYEEEEDPFASVFASEGKVLLLWNKDYAILSGIDSYGESYTDFVMTYKQFKKQYYDLDFENNGIIAFRKILADYEYFSRCSYDTSTNRDDTPDAEKKAYISNYLFNQSLLNLTGDSRLISKGYAAATYRFADNDENYYTDLLKVAIAYPGDRFYPSNPINGGPFVFMRSHDDKPKSTMYDVSTDDSLYPVYVWLEGNIIYYYSESPNVYVKDASGMFSRMYIISADLSEINFSETIRTEAMFINCDILKTVDFGSAKFAKVINTTGMFFECHNLEKILVDDNWNLSNVTYNPNYGPPMFLGCNSLPGYDIEKYNDENYKDMIEAVIGKYLTKK